MSDWAKIQNIVTNHRIFLFEKLEECYNLHFKCEERLECLIIKWRKYGITDYVGDFFTSNLKKELKDFQQFQEMTFKQINNIIENVTSTLKEVVQLVEHLLEGIEKDLQNSDYIQEILSEFHEALKLVEKQNQASLDQILAKIVLALGILTSLSSTGVGIAVALVAGGYLAVRYKTSMEELDSKLEQILVDIQSRCEQNQVLINRGREKVRKTLQVFGSNLLKKSVSISPTAIVWYDASIDNQENLGFQKLIKNRFDKIQNFYFVKDAKQFQDILSLNLTIFLILQGSSSEEFLPQLTNNQSEVLQKLIEIFTSGTIIGSVSLYWLPNYFTQYSYMQYLTKEKFNIKQLKLIPEKEALEIINKTIEFVPQDVLNCQEIDKKDLAKGFSNAKCIEAILNLYTQEGLLYKLLNSILLTLNEKAILRCELFISQLVFSIQQYNDQINENNFAEIKLYRGIRYSIDNFKKNNKVGDLIVFPAFTSTTSRLDRAKFFAGNQGLIYKISFKNQNDLNLIRPKYIGKVSKFQTEEEYLFSCFSCFIIKEIGESVVELEFTSF